MLRIYVLSTGDNFHKERADLLQAYYKCLPVCDLILYFKTAAIESDHEGQTQKNTVSL